MTVYTTVDVDFVRYHISVVGKMWMPTATAAMEVDINKRDWNVIDTDFDNLTLEELEHYMYTHTGDLSQITDYKIEKTIECRPKTSVGDDGWLEVTHRSKHYVMRDWEDEDSPNILIDCLYPIYE